MRASLALREGRARWCVKPESRMAIRDDTRPNSGYAGGGAGCYNFALSAYSQSESL